MNRDWRIRNGISRVSLATTRCIRLVKEDAKGRILDLIKDVTRLLGLFSVLKQFAHQSGVISAEDETQFGMNQFRQRLSQEVSNNTASNGSKPVIFASACMDREQHGGWKYNGGIKELNNLVKLLRKHGYEAYMVTYDGSYEPWLIDHQPHISIAELQHKLRSTTDVRCVTSWATAKAFIDECPNLYFWDMELASTDHDHFAILADLYKRKIKGSAAISSTIRAWHMAHFERPCSLIPNLLDESIWFPIDRKRQPMRIGYMDEGPHTEDYIGIVRETAQYNGLNFEFQLLRGSEADMIAAMQSCEIFLGMNIGKDKLWGEGCPRVTAEAPAAGCVMIAFDIIGNREIIQSGFNGVLVPRYRPDLMANALVNLYQKSGELERIRQNSLALIHACHTFDARWLAIKEFLELAEPEALPSKLKIQEYASVS
jgi:glycosyltransferase involved in cell wall biosynthesis